MDTSALSGANLQSPAVARAVQLLATFDGTFNGKEAEQVHVPMTLEDYKLLNELLFGTPHQERPLKDSTPLPALHQLGSHLQNYPLELAYDPVGQKLIIMFSTELRSTFSQELGAVLHDHIKRKLIDLAHDDKTPSEYQSYAKQILPMLTVSYNCAILNPSTGTQEMILPAVIMHANYKSCMDLPVVMLMVHFSSEPDDQTAARLLEMYPSATIFRVNIPYLDPEARLEHITSKGIDSAFTCSYDVIVRAQKAVWFWYMDSTPPSTLPPADKLRFFARNRPLVQNEMDDKENTIDIPSFVLTKVDAWPSTGLPVRGHWTGGGGGKGLSIKLQHACLRKSLAIAAVRQKNTDLLRLGFTRRIVSSMSSGGFRPPSLRGLHTVAFSRTSASNPAHISTCGNPGTDRNNNPVAVHRGHGRNFDLTFRGVGGLDTGNAKMKTVLGFGWRLARRGRC